MDDKLNRHISKVQTPNDQVYYIVPEAIKNGSYVINSPTLNADTQFVITSQNQVISGQKDFSTAPRVFVTDHYEPVLTAADIPSNLFMSFSIADATEETVDNIPGYTWDLTEEQFTSLCNPATQSVIIEVLIPESAELTQHYIFRRDYAALVGVLGGANFFAVDSSQATTDVIGTAMRLRVYRNVTWLKLRVEDLGELTSNPVKTINSTAPTEGNISLKTINGNEIVGSGNITIADNNQTIKGNGTAFNANDAINIVGSGATTVTADTTNKKITISTPAVTDHNQTIKGNGTAFGADAAVNIVGGGATTVTADTTNKKITISTPAVTDTNQKVKAGSVTFGADDVVNFEGSGIVSVTGDATNDKITISASHQSIKTLDTTATTAQSTNASEAITGSGKVTLHKVAKTGTYGDLIGTPTIPTVNNGTLTIQKNGTNVQTFTANQDSNVTANITVPVNLSDISNRNQSYIQWGGPNLVGEVSPLEVASIDDLGHNKFAFMSAASVTIQYSRDAGSTWIDYGADDATKRKLVTLSSNLHIGNRTGSSNTVNDRLRIILNANIAGGNVYCNLRRLLIYLSTEGSGGSQVTVEHKTIGNYLSGTDTWNKVGTYNVSGWSGWNSIPFSGPFGGNSTQTSQTAQIRLTFSVTSVRASSNNLTIFSIRGIAFPLWMSPSTMASTGHLYSYDINQNASFPSGVSASSFTEDGTLLTNKYLGKTAKAADADKLDGNDSTYYLNYNNLTNKPTIPAAQVNSDWNASSGVAQILNKPSLATVATSGSYNDLSNKPTIPTVDSAMSTTSTNPVQNKVVNAAITAASAKAGKVVISGTEYTATWDSSTGTLTLS